LDQNAEELPSVPVEEPAARKAGSAGVKKDNEKTKEKEKEDKSEKGKASAPAAAAKKPVKGGKESEKRVTGKMKVIVVLISPPPVLAPAPAAKAAPEEEAAAPPSNAASETSKRKIKLRDKGVLKEEQEKVKSLGKMLSHIQK
jgi:hypothetical protein